MAEVALKNILEALLMVAQQPLTVKTLCTLLEETATETEIRQTLTDLSEDCAGHSFELKKVASGFRYQTREQYSPWIARLWQEKPQRYSHALLETLAIIAYLQPVTRSRIEEIRGVSLSSSIMRTLEERSWIAVTGHKEAPGHPALYGTTKAFLDYFNLSSCSDLPPLPETQEMFRQHPELFASEKPGATGPGKAEQEPVSETLN